MRKWSLLLAMVVAVTVLTMGVHAGGWAVATVHDLPEYAVVGRPMQIRFVVRGAGVQRMYSAETPKLIAKSGAASVEAFAAKTEKEGEYVADLTFPRTGAWTIRIWIWPADDFQDRFNGVTLPELTVLAAGAAPPPPIRQDASGGRLFVSKGCTTCHSTPGEREARARESLPTSAQGPYLFGRSFPEVYLKRFHDDPETAEGDRHELGLTSTEVAALMAFFNSEKRQ